MMKSEIFKEFSGSNDQTIVKGKRTKRLRPSCSTSSNGGGRGGAGEFYNSLVSSPTTSSGISTTTEEDEDMASCLILLARGNSPPQVAASENKFSSQKITELATMSNRKVGAYVYECKTCNRTFPSFQALGGHRASHKKLKTTPHDDQKESSPADNKEEEETPSPSTQLFGKICHNDQKKPKIHECSICGSEFASGQALGGHMRKHRPVTSTSTRTATSNDNDTSSYDVVENPRNLLAFDLNLPAPPEDEKLQRYPAKQQPHLAFSAAALVNCRY